MNLLTKVYISIWVISFSIVAWSAAIPNPFNRRRVAIPIENDAVIDPVIAVESEYYWFYPLFFFVSGLIIFLISWPPKKPIFFRWFCASFVPIIGLYFMFFSIMHAPPVHFHAVWLLLFISVLCIFMTGYACGMRKNT